MWPRGTNRLAPRFTATISDPRGRCSCPSGTVTSVESASSRYSSSRISPPANDFGVDRAGRRHHALDVGGQLRLGPQHPVDAEFFEPLPLFRARQEVRARDHANGLGARQPIGDRAGHDVDFIERRRRDEEPRVLDAGPLEDFFARAAADDEFDVDVGEGVGDRAIVIDDDHFMIRRQCPRQGRADLPAADDYDAHLPMAGNECS